MILYYLINCVLLYRITFARAKLLAAQYKIQEILYPLFVDDPSVFLYATALHNPMSNGRMNSLNGYRFNNNNNNNNSSSPYQQWDRQLSLVDHNSSKGFFFFCAVLIFTHP